MFDFMSEIFGIFERFFVNACGTSHVTFSVVYLINIVFLVGIK